MFAFSRCCEIQCVIWVGSQNIIGNGTLKAVHFHTHADLVAVLCLAVFAFVNQIAFNELQRKAITEAAVLHKLNENFTITRQSFRNVTLRIQP